MKRRCLSISLCILGVALIITGQMVRENGVMRLYGDELKRCEWVWKNWKEYTEIRNCPSPLDYNPIYDGIHVYAVYEKEKRYSLMYCIRDLNDDDMPELIVGVQEIETQAINIRNIFYYDDGSLMADFADRYRFEIYKGGFIETTMIMYGDCRGTEYSYCCYLPDLGKHVHLESLGVSVEKPLRFFRIMDNEQQIEITEEEYDYRKERYTGLGKEEFQWKELQGFLEGGDTFESLFGDY